jgi:hypothetical protein
LEERLRRFHDTTRPYSEAETDHWQHVATLAQYGVPREERDELILDYRRVLVAHTEPDLLYAKVFLG